MFFATIQIRFHHKQNERQEKEKVGTPDFRLDPQADGSARQKIGSDKPDEKVYPSRRKTKHKKKTDAEN